MSKLMFNIRFRFCVTAHSSLINRIRNPTAHFAQIVPGVDPISCPFGTGGSFSGGKAAGK
jgi:hypothetical protein